MPSSYMTQSLDSKAQDLSFKMPGVNIKFNPLRVTVVLAIAACFVVFMWSGRKLKQQTVSLKQLLSAGIDIAERGGQEVIAVRKANDLKEESKGKTKEGANDPLTEGDLRSHRAMMYGLLKLYPNLKIISEEKDRGMPDMSLVKIPATLREELDVYEDMNVPISDITVWIDPLDATQEYTEKLLNYVTTMVCIAVKGKPVVGIIHQPFEKFTAWGWVLRGHSSNLHTKHASENRIIVSRSHTGDADNVLKETFGKEIEIIHAGGAGFKTLEVIKGNAGAYIHVTLIKKWDICAGNAVLASMGGNMTTIAGEEIDYSSVGSPANKHGLVAALSNHASYVAKMKKGV